MFSSPEVVTLFLIFPFIAHAQAAATYMDSMTYGGELCRSYDDSGDSLYVTSYGGADDLSSNEIEDDDAGDDDDESNSHKPPLRYSGVVVVVFVQKAMLLSSHAPLGFTQGSC